MAPAELTSAQRKTVYISLYQTHVPKLDDVGLINYDRETGEIDLSRCARALDTYLVDKPGLMIRWNRYYLVLSLMSIMLLGGVWFKVDPSALLSSLMATMIIVTAYSLLAILQYLIYRRRIVPATPPELRRIEGQ
nr:hypothetical protein [Haladaptatus halobius]